MANIVVLGGNFAGITAALQLKRKLKKGHTVTIISPSANFLYVPSLIWVPFGRRKVKDISFPIGPLLEKKGVTFINDSAERVDVEKNQVLTDNNGTVDYDYLVVASGAQVKNSILEHLDPKDGYVSGIVTPPHAEAAYEKFKKLVANPGPVVVGSTQGASCMGAAYEYLFNLDHELRRHGVRKQVEVTWLTPEPFLGHFGIGGIWGGKGMLEVFMKLYNIKWKCNSSIAKIEKEKITTGDGTEFPFKMAMLIPPFSGAKVMMNTPELTDENGFVVTNESYQSVNYPNVFAAGLAVQVQPPFKCVTPFGVPKTGFPSDVMGKIVAKNIIRLMKGKTKLVKKAFGKIPGICVMDAGSKEVWIFANHLFKPRQFAIMIPNLVGSFFKWFLEKYMLFKNRHGYTFLP